MPLNGPSQGQQQLGVEMANTEAFRWILTGRVQGVGYRPFVYRLARQYGLAGWVQNQRGRVEILAQGEPGQLTAFGNALLARAPPLADPQILSMERRIPSPLVGFSIRSSSHTGETQIHVPPDYFICDDCHDELSEPQDRRYRYPFINCTQCGPRYTLIERLPYDRANTAMSAFSLCPECRSEYTDPLDRRFHAEPIACPACGPRLRFRTTDGCAIDDTQAALAACVGALRNAAIVAVKGIGGFHLMCDARDDDAVVRLRTRKPRPHKPLAVMFPITGTDGLASVRREVKLRPEERDMLHSPVRPIVLARKADGGTLSDHIAPDLSEIGVMLPYSPLHHLLLQDFGAPLVATSANVSGEPVLTDGRDVEARLGHITAAILDHNRPIIRPADDPVFRAIDGSTRPLRLGRGCAPMEATLPFSLPAPLLAVGGHMKTTIALGWKNRLVVSPHIGDMGTPRSFAVFEQVLRDLQSLYDAKAETVVCDAHPGYTTTRWAERCGRPVSKVFHHHAHASALAGEAADGDPWLVFTWDGVGFGEDGALWGGETLLGRPGQWRRVGSMRPFFLPGSDRASRQPWRSAVATCWELGREWQACPEDTALLYRAWQRHLNAPKTTAVGRLFDAAAALTGILHEASYEGQGPMYLEALCDEPGQAVALPLAKNSEGLWETDWAPLILYLLDERISAAERAAGFHTSLAVALLAQAITLRAEYGIERVGMCGGVFQNRHLTEQAVSLLKANGFTVKLAERFPVNDAAISVGQIIEAGAALLFRD